MIQKEIIEGNKLIAEFMGAIITQCYSYIEDIQDGLEYYFSKENAPEDRLRYSSSGIKYHSSWDWLMPVVEKIESIETEQDGHFGVFISSNTCMIQGTKLYLALKAPKTYGFVYMSDPNAVFPTKLESTWYNVVEFIKWYNKKEICNICHGKTSCSCEDTNITPGG